MDLYLIAKFASAFVFVISLMLLLQWGLRRAGLASPMGAGGKRRLKIIDSLPVDSRRRFVLVRRDETEHLVMLGPNGDTVVETGIAVPKDQLAQKVVELHAGEDEEGERRHAQT